MARKRSRPDSPPHEEWAIAPASDAVVAQEMAIPKQTRPARRREKRFAKQLLAQTSAPSSRAGSALRGDSGETNVDGGEGGEEEDEQEPQEQEEVDAVSGDDDDIQRKYFQPYPFPAMAREEDRAMFDMSEQDMRVYAVPKIHTSLVKVCTICTSSEHSDNACPELSCVHCGKHNLHFSKACPEIRPSSPDDVIKLPPYDWRSKARRETPAQRRPLLKPFCYNCAAIGHYGYDCSDQRSGVIRDTPSSFSGVHALEYVAEDDKLSLAEYDHTSKTHKGSRERRYGRCAQESRFSPLFDPFHEYKRSYEGSRYTSQLFLSRNSGSGAYFAGRGGGAARGGGSGNKSGRRQNDRGGGGGGGSSYLIPVGTAVGGKQRRR